MSEIGGYIELDTFHLPMLHDEAKALNCGRNALGYLIEARHITRIRLPYFLCSSVYDVCKKYGVSIRGYHIGYDFLPKDTEVQDGEWFYLVNYYGQVTQEYIQNLHTKIPNLIVDQAQAYFEQALPHIDTLYTCRKFFGVPDGAFLYTDEELARELPQDESFQRFHYILGRYERTASEFYRESVKNNHEFSTQPIKTMSKLTMNMLHAIDYEFVNKKRTENFALLHSLLQDMNELQVRCVDGAFMYPLMIPDAEEVKKKLLAEQIYIPVLWPNVLDECPENWIEWILAKHILPLPCDQRYGESHMRKIVNRIKNL